MTNDTHPNLTLQRAEMFNRVAVLAAGLVLLHLLLIGLLAGRPDLRQIASELIQDAQDLLAVVALSYTVLQQRRAGGRWSVPWVLVTLALVSYLTADLIFSVIVIALQQNPFPSIADLFHLAFYPLFGLGVLRLPVASQRRRSRLLIDSGIAMCAATLVLWTLILGRTLQAGSADRLTLSLVLTYPALDLGLLWVLVALLMRPLESSQRRPVLLLAAGIAIVIVPDVLFSYQDFQGTYAEGTLLDIGWTLSTGLFALAGMVAARGNRSVDQAPSAGSGSPEPLALSLYLPYGLMMASCVFLVWAYVAEMPINWEIAGFCAGAIFLLVLVRQYVTLKENTLLYRSAQSELAGRMQAEAEVRELNAGLERRVGERTAELARANRELAVLYDTALAISAQLEPVVLFNAITQRAAELLDASRSVLFLLAPDRQSLHLAVGHNMPLQGPEADIPLGAGLSGRVAQTGEALDVEDYRSYEGRAPAYASLGIRRALAVPLKTRERVDGVLAIFDDRRTERFSADQVRLASLFAAQAAIAIENARLYTSLGTTNAELKDALQTRDEMIQNVSHELRTPLTIMQGYNELFYAGDLGPLTSSQAEATATIAHQVQRLRFMVDRLLALQTFDAGQLHCAALAVAPWLSRLNHDWQVRAVQAQLSIQFMAPEVLPPVLADVQFLDHVAQNLLDNAVKFGHAGGMIRLAAVRQAATVLITVSDDGIGIPADKLHRLFQRFYQVDGSTRREFGGVGIGLALARAIVEAHGGRIWATSPGPGQGAVFSFTLPLAHQS